MQGVTCKLTRVRFRARVLSSSVCMDAGSNLCCKCHTHLRLFVNLGSTHSAGFLAYGKVNVCTDSTEVLKFVVHGVNGVMCMSTALAIVEDLRARLQKSIALGLYVADIYRIAHAGFWGLNMLRRICLGT